MTETKYPFAPITYTPIFEFTTQDIERLYKSQGVTARRERLWPQAFAYYNAHHPNKLSMGCYSCFGKVLQFIMLQKIKSLQQ